MSNTKKLFESFNKYLNEYENIDFVYYACSVIEDYLYNENKNYKESWALIKEFIYNNICVDEFDDYKPSPETMEAIKRKLKNDGYIVWDFEIYGIYFSSEEEKHKFIEENNLIEDIDYEDVGTDMIRILSDKELKKGV